MSVNFLDCLVGVCFFMIVYFVLFLSLNHPHKEFVSFVELHETVLDVLD